MVVNKVPLHEMSDIPDETSSSYLMGWVLVYDPASATEETPETSMSSIPQSSKPQLTRILIVVATVAAIFVVTFAAARLSGSSLRELPMPREHAPTPQYRETPG